MSQKQKVISQIKNTGQVSRNWALTNFISRLGSLVCDLNKEGYHLTGEYQKTENGQDFIYVNKPSEPVIQELFNSSRFNEQL